MTESIPASHTCGFELVFDIVAALHDEPDGEFEQIVHDVPTDVLQKMLMEAVRTVRDYALPVGDAVSERALHGEINFMLDELDRRGS